MRSLMEAEGLSEQQAKKNLKAKALQGREEIPILVKSIFSVLTERASAREEVPYDA